MHVQHSDDGVFDGLARLDRANDKRLQAELYLQAQNTLEAVRLIELGARAGLVRQLTGLERKVVNRLYRQLVGRSSPPGQMPFSDAWYLKDTHRMLQAATVWQLYKRLAETGRSAARTLIDVYEGYRGLVDQPLLSVTRAHVVPRLVAMKVWHERECRSCQTPYLAPVVSLGASCPGCQLYYHHRCRRCGNPLEVSAMGRYRESCDPCKQVRKWN